MSSERDVVLSKWMECFKALLIGVGTGGGGGTGGMCPPMFHKLLYKLLTTLCSFRLVLTSLVPKVRPAFRHLQYGK